MHRRELREETSFAAVRPPVEHQASTPRDECPVAPGARLELDDHALSPVVGCDELLLARKDELDRPARSARERRDVPLEVEVALRAKATAQQRHDDAHVGLRDLEYVGHAAPGRKRHLRRCPDSDAVALPLGEDGARLDRGALGRVGDIATLHDDVGLGHRRVRVAFHDGRVAEHVAVPSHLLVVLGLV